MLNFKRLRTDAGMTQSDIANKLGVTLRTYQRMEKDPDALNQKDLHKIATIFGVKAQTIIGDGNIQVHGSQNAVNGTATQSKYAELFALIEAYATPKLIDEFTIKLLKIKEVVDA